MAEEGVGAMDVGKDGCDVDSVYGYRTKTLRTISGGIEGVAYEWTALLCGVAYVGAAYHIPVFRHSIVNDFKDGLAEGASLYFGIFLHLKTFRKIAGEDVTDGIHGSLECGGIGGGAAIASRAHAGYLFGAADRGENGVGRTGEDGGGESVEVLSCLHNKKGVRCY